MPREDQPVTYMTRSPRPANRTTKPQSETQSETQAGDENIESATISPPDSLTDLQVGSAAQEDSPSQAEETKEDRPVAVPLYRVKASQIMLSNGCHHHKGDTFQTLIDLESFVTSGFIERI